VTICHVSIGAVSRNSIVPCLRSSAHMRIVMPGITTA